MDRQEEDIRAEKKRSVGLRLALSFVGFVASFVLGYVYQVSDLSGPAATAVVAFFYAFVILWLIGLASAIFAAVKQLGSS